MPAKKQVTKEMILTAALELLREGGIEAVNVKALAHRLNCSTQPIYLSFPEEIPEISFLSFLKTAKHSLTLPLQPSFGS